MKACRDGVILAILLASSATNALSAPPWFGWRTFFGGSKPDPAGDIAVDGDDNIYVVGSAADDWGAPGGPCPMVNSKFSGTHPNAFVVKLDSAGKVAWCSFLGTAATAYGVAVGCDGNVYVTGQTGGFAAGDECLVGSVAPASLNGFVAKLDASNGKVQGGIKCAGSLGKAVAAKCDGPANHVYVAGQAGGEEGQAFAVELEVPPQADDFSPVNVGECRYAAPSHVNAIALDGDGDVYVAGRGSGKPFAGRCSPGAEPEAFKRFEELPDVDNLLGEAWAVALDGSGKIYVAGRLATQAFLATHDQSGDLIDEEVFGSASHADVATGIVVGSGPDSYLVGYSGASWQAPEVDHAGGEDAWVARVTGTGVTWNSFFGGEGGEWATGIAHDASGRIIVVGYGAAPWAAVWPAPIVGHVGSDDPFVLKTSLVVPCASSECDNACRVKRKKAWKQYRLCIANEAASHDSNPESFNDDVFDACRSTYFGTWEGCSSRFEYDVETVTDRLTGLVWERKTRTGDPGGLHSTDTTYGWSKQGSTGKTGTAFKAFVPSLNAGAGFAGEKGWRIPTLAELQSIMDASGTGMVPDFPDRENNADGQYWSSTSSPIVHGGCTKKSSCAWNVMFTPPSTVIPKTGSVSVNGKGTDGSGGKQHVRAVRGGW